MLARRSLEFDRVVLICLAVKFKSFKPAPPLDAAAKCPHSLAAFRVATVASGLSSAPAGKKLICMVVPVVTRVAWLELVVLGLTTAKYAKKTKVRIGFLRIRIRLL